MQNKYKTHKSELKEEYLHRNCKSMPETAIINVCKFIFKDKFWSRVQNLKKRDDFGIVNIHKKNGVSYTRKEWKFAVKVWHLVVRKTSVKREESYCKAPPDCYKQEKKSKLKTKRNSFTFPFRYFIFHILMIFPWVPFYMYIS